MVESDLTAEYWSSRYQEQNDGWDIGQVSPPLRAYFDQLEDPTHKILIPGCGRGYEGIYLINKGFHNVYFVDFSAVPLRFIKNQVSNLPEDQLIQSDFFELDGQYDLIIEQTLFCAIDPALRSQYASKVYDLLRPGGKLVGLLFNRDFEGGPPFGGNEHEYRSYFEPLFSSVMMSPCYNSLPPRMGAELFVKLIR